MPLNLREIKHLFSIPSDGRLPTLKTPSKSVFDISAPVSSQTTQIRCPQQKAQFPRHLNILLKPPPSLFLSSRELPRLKSPQPYDSNIKKSLEMPRLSSNHFFSWDKFSPCCPGYPQPYNPRIFTSYMLGLQACVSMPDQQALVFFRRKENKEMELKRHRTFTKHFWHRAPPGYVPHSGR